MHVALVGNYGNMIRKLSESHQVLHIPEGIAAKNLVSAVERKETKILEQLVPYDTIHLDWSAFEEAFVASAKLRKDIVLTVPSMKEFNRISEEVKKLFEVFDIESLAESGQSLVLKKDFYDDIILQGMGGNNEVQGGNEHDGVCQLVCGSLKRLNEFVSYLGQHKDVLLLDVKLENILRWCRNQTVPGIERMELAAVLINCPLVEAESFLDEEGLIRKMYEHLNDGNYRDLMEHMSLAGYPYVIANVVREVNQAGKGSRMYAVDLPQWVVNSSHYVVRVMSNDLFLLKVKGK